MRAPARVGRRRRVCFFSKVQHPSILQRVEFYAQDIQLLEELGFDVHVVTRIRDIRPADIYFVWWWTWAFAPLIVAKLLRRPIVVTGVLDLPSWGPRPWYQKLCMRLALRFADVNVFCSQMEYRDIPARFSTRVPRYIPLSVDTDRYAPGTGTERPIVVSVGWLQKGNAERKGMFDVVRAAPLIHAAHPEARFLIVGEKGTAFDELSALVTSLGAAGYVEFTGPLPAPEKIKLVQECSVYLQPTRHEGFGVAILEALSCGAPVVTRDAGAVGEVVGDAARLVTGSEPEDVARAVIELLDDRALRESMRARGRARAVSTYSYVRRRQAMMDLLTAIE